MKETSVFLPEKEMKKKYTALANEEKKKSFYFFPSMICGIIVIFWLTYLTTKVEEKDVLIRDDDTIEEITELMAEKKKAEDESRVLLKILEHHAQIGNNGTAVDFEREERAVLQIIAQVFSGLSLICSTAKLAHQAAADAGWGVYGKWHKEIVRYKEETKLYQAQIMCKKRYVDEINERIMKTLKTYQYSKVRANAVYETYSTVLMTLKAYQDDLRDPQKVNATTQEIVKVQKMIVSDTQDLGLRWRDEYINDFVFIGEDILALTFTGWGPQILEWMAGGASSAMDFAGIASGLSIAKSIVKIAYCIHGHTTIVGEKRKERDLAKKEHDLVKDAYGQLEKSLKNMDSEVDLMNEKITALSEYANEMFKLFKTDCTSSSGTILSDLEEIDSYVKFLKRNFDLKVDIESSLKYTEQIIQSDLDAEKEELEEEGETMTPEEENKFRKRRMKINVKIQYKALKSKHPKIDPDDLLDKMQIMGFDFPFRWTKWSIKSKDVSCQCTNAGSKCFVTKQRTCISGKCQGNAEKTYDQCERDKIHFFNKCKSRDQAFVGSCIAPDKSTVGSGELSGQYVSAGIKEGQCYRDCKSFPGVHGCEYMKTACSPTQGCRGECFAITENIKSADRMPDVTCYKFEEPTSGDAALPMLKQVFDATEQMMTGQNYDTAAFNEMYLYFMKIDPNIIIAQENAWKEMVKYQSTGLQDKWGQNPSEYKERDKRSLTFQNTDTVIFEPCNFASNWAYYHLATSTKDLQWFDDKTKKALVQASTGLAFSSSFFHGSHTELGQLLDNHMIKIIAFILYQTHIDTSGFTDPVLTNLVAERKRKMSGVEMAEHMTNVFKDLPATQWKEKAEEMDVPSYELSISALGLTLLEQMEATGYVASFVTSNMMSSMGVPDHEISFLKNEFTTKLKAGVSKWNSENDNMWKKPDTYNTFVTFLRTFAAFPYQENMKAISKSHLSFFNWLIDAINGVSASEKVLSQLETFNKNLNHFSTLPEIEAVNLNRRETCPIEAQHIPVKKMELFPGYQRCKSTNDHSLWHAQSARGLLDSFNLANEFIRKQKDHFNPTDYDKITQEAEAILTDTYNGIADAANDFGKKVSEEIQDAQKVAEVVANDLGKKVSQVKQDVVNIGKGAQKDVVNVFTDTKEVIGNMGGIGKGMFGKW